MHEEDSLEDDVPSLLLDGEVDPLLEQAVQLYLELRLQKRPPEGEAGARRKALKWLTEECAAKGRPVEVGWEAWLNHAFLDAEGDVAEATARRRHTRRAALSES